MSENLQDDHTETQLALFAADFHVKTSRLLDAVRDWMESEAGFGLSSFELYRNLRQSGLPLKMSLVCYPHTLEKTRQAIYTGETDGKPQKQVTYPSSFKGWQNAGIGGPTGCLTLSIGEFPSDADVCSLSQVLETGPVPHKYYLSPKAARGILRRADKRGRKLPEVLRRALMQVVSMDKTLIEET